MYIVAFRENACHTKRVSEVSWLADQIRWDTVSFGTVLKFRKVKHLGKKPQMRVWWSPPSPAYDCRAPRNSLPSDKILIVISISLQPIPPLACKMNSGQQRFIWLAHLDSSDLRRATASRLIPSITPLLRRSLYHKKWRTRAKTKESPRLKGIRRDYATSGTHKDTFACASRLS